ncbi:MAG: DegV family protein [Bacillota bacterium]
MPVRIVTDSSASLPAETAQAHGISVVPLNVQFGTQSYADGLDINAPEMARRMNQGEAPTTSQPAPGVFADIYRSLKEEADSIISMHVMGSASGTVSTARLATTLCPDQDITVFDSGTVSMGLGFMAMAAARAAALGQARDEILTLLEDARSRVHVFVALPTVTHLVRGGRVTRGAGLLASLLAIKPILSLTNGAVEVIDKVRTFPRALDRLADLMERAVGGRRVRLAVMHGNCLEEARTWFEGVRERFSATDVVFADAGSALMVHGGPGMIGLVAFEE